MVKLANYGLSRFNQRIGRRAAMYNLGTDPWLDGTPNTVVTLDRFGCPKPFSGRPCGQRPMPSGAISRELAVPVDRERGAGVQALLDKSDRETASQQRPLRPSPLPRPWVKGPSGVAWRGNRSPRFSAGGRSSQPTSRQGGRVRSARVARVWCLAKMSARRRRLASDGVVSTSRLSATTSRSNWRSAR